MQTLSLKVSNILYNQIHLIQRQLNKEQASNNYLFFRNLMEYNPTANELTLKCANVAKGHDYDILTICPRPCSAQKGNFNCEAGDKPGHGSEICIHDMCLFIDVRNSDISTDFTTEYVNQYLDLAFYTAFKEQFLMQSILGKKYIRYYYSIGNYLKSSDKFDLKTKIQSVKLAPLAYKIVKTLQGSSDDIVITDKEKAEFVQLLQVYKNLSDNKDYQTILADIEADMNIFAGKSRSNLVEYVNSQK